MWQVLPRPSSNEDRDQPLRVFLRRTEDGACFSPPTPPPPSSPGLDSDQGSGGWGAKPRFCSSLSF